MSFFKNKLVIKIRLRLFLLIFCLSVIPLVAIVLYSQRSAFNMLLHQSKEYHNSTLNNIIRDFQKNTANVENVVSNILNTQIYSDICNSNNKLINDELKMMSNLDKLRDSLDEKNIFNQMFLNDYGDIAVVYPNKKSILTGQTRIDYIANRNFIVNYEILKEQKYFETLNKKITNISFCVVDDGSIIGNGFEISNVFFIPKYTNGSLDFFTMVFTKQQIWDTLFADSRKDKNNLLYIVDKNNKIAWTNEKKSKDNENLFVNIDIQRIIGKLEKSQDTVNSQKYFGQINYHDKKYMIFSDIDITTQAKFLLLVPMTNVTYLIAVFIKILIIFFGVLVLLIVISSLVSSNLFAKPIEEHNQVLNNENLYFMNIAHETKTPLTLIINYLDMYISQHGMDYQLSVIRDNIEKIKNNMLGFLDIGKIERGQEYSAKKITINLSKYIILKTELYKITSEKKQIEMEVSVEDQIFVLADNFCLDRILDNIVDDAIKYTKNGGKIFFSLCSQENFAIIKVRDTGIGIDKKHLKHLFQPYHQVSEYRATTGTGLGLYIIKQLVESLGGSIFAESTKGVGTEFTIKIPQIKTDEIKVEDISEQNNAKQVEYLNSNNLIEIAKVERKDYRILIVEDNDDLRNYLVNVINRYYVVYDSCNGEDALQKLDEITKPHLIISDVMMDKMNGFDFFEKLQQNSKFRDIPFIFLSALTALPEKLRGLEIGAIDYIQKPFEIEELLAKIKSLFTLTDLKKALGEKEKYASLGILLGGISHEIFNPLACIYGPLENLERILEKTGNNDEKTQMFIENIWTNIKRIESIVKSVKSLYSNKEYEKTQTNVCSIVETVINILQTKIKNRQLEIVNLLPKELTLYTSGNALTQIYMNLISNAIDAIDEKRTDGRIEIGMSQSDNKLELFVSDNGSGIAQDKISTIFDAFYSSKEVGKGMGLGLYIVKDLVAKLGYEISVTSCVGEGTKFIIKV